MNYICNLGHLNVPVAWLFFFQAEQSAVQMQCFMAELNISARSQMSCNDLNKNEYSYLLGRIMHTVI